MKKIISLIIFSGLIIFSCTRDAEEEMVSECMEDGPITYLGHVKIIIDTKCSYSGCHDTANSAPGNYTQFTGINQATKSGDFASEVLESSRMPPPDVTQAQLLSDDQLLLLRCWAQDGYLEQ